MTEDTTPNEPGDRRRRILEAAMLEFADKGLDGARVDEIARAAGVNKQLLYYYFGDKRRLYEAALARTYEAYGEFYAAGPPGEAYVDRIVRFTRNQAATENDRWRRLALWQALQQPAGGGDDDATRAAWQSAVEELVIAQRDGELDGGIDTEMLTLVAVGLIHMPHMLPQASLAVTGIDPESDEFIERHARFLAAVLARLAPRDV